MTDLEPGAVATGFFEWRLLSVPDDPVATASGSNPFQFRFALGNVSVDTYAGDGTWRSLVARTLGVGEVPSSNLGVPKNSRQ
jgi:hypothetical protein